MNKEVILLLSELRSQIDDTISRIYKENALDEKESVSTLMNMPFVDVHSVLGERASTFFEYLEFMNFIKIARTELNFVYTHYRREPMHEWVEFRNGKGWYCHPALIALFEIYDKSR